MTSIRFSALALLTSLLCVASVSQVHAVSLDEHDEIRLGLRTYALARVGTERFDFTDDATVLKGSFPPSAAGHVRQLRHFIEVGLDHNLERLVREGFGPLALLKDLPFRLSNLKYSLEYRGEYEGIYDFGPSEFRTAEAFFAAKNVLTGAPLPPKVVNAYRRKLRDIAVHRERLFQAFVEASVGDLFVRFGRQILVWGETDVFRLLDNVNPTDSSFGGFLIPLDERRVPLNMLRANYAVGSLGFLSDLFVEGYAAVDTHVAYFPGIPSGSPWAPPTIAYPNTTLFPVLNHPPATLSAARGGVQVKANLKLPPLGSVTVGAAYYCTRFDLPGVQTLVHKDLFTTFPGSYDDAALVKLLLTAPLVQVSGASATFVLPARYVRTLGLSGEPVVRTELAYFHDEPRYSQAQIDPFVILGNTQCEAAPSDGVCTGGRRVGDSWNFVLGIDHNQFIRWLNPDQSILFSTQFFYKHLRGAIPRRPVESLPSVINGEVVPVLVEVDKQNLALPLAHTPVDQYVQTLLIATSYVSGTVTPALLLVYDWSGSFAALPQVTLSRDPFRFTFGYDFITANTLKGASGISLFRDRDNVFFQIEYVI